MTRLRDPFSISARTKANNLFTFVTSRLRAEAPSTLRWKKFENGCFTTKLNELFSIHTIPGNFKNATTTCQFVFKEISARETHITIVAPSFSKSSDFRMFSVRSKIATFRSEYEYGTDYEHDFQILNQLNP